MPRARKNGSQEDGQHDTFDDRRRNCGHVGGWRMGTGYRGGREIVPQMPALALKRMPEIVPEDRQKVCWYL
jgi:hypothetical protein